jgi:hypothetical protein
MKSFVISSGAAIITDPSYDRQPVGCCQNICEMVLNGKWLSHNENVLCAIHEQYKEYQLSWKPADYLCGIDSARIGVYDLEQYDPDQDFDNGTIDWGVTLFTGADGFASIEIGYDESHICGIREQCHITYYCDRCRATIYKTR